MKRQDCPTLSRLPARCDRGPVALRFGCGSAALNLCVRSLHRFYYSAPIILTLSLAAATNDLASALQTGLFEEEANHNLEAAAAAYQAVTAQFDKDRKLAATAIFRLGEVYRKQGKTNEAVLQYERIVREFSDQETLATLSRQQVSALGRGVATATAAAAAESSAQLTAARVEVASLTAELEQLQSLSGEELRLTVPHNYPNPMLTDLMKQLAAAQQRRVGLQKDFSPEHPEVARVTAQIAWLENQVQAQVTGTIRALEVKLNAAKAVLAHLEKTSIAAPTAAGASENAQTSTDEEEEEIRRLQAMIRNSPDLINAPSGSAGPGNMTPLCLAASRGQLRVARFLLENGASVEQKAGDGPGFIQTGAPVHHAAAGGHKAMIELLTQYKADLEARDKDGRMPLHIAASRGFQGVAEALVAANADVNARTKTEATPLHLAVVFGHRSLTAFLIVKGAKVNAQDGAGQTSLLHAAMRGDSEVLNRLISAKADPNILDSSSRSALSYAAGNGHADTVKALLEAKADPNAGTRNVPLAVACNREGTNIANLLLRAGADPNRAAPVDFDVSLDGRIFRGTAPFTPLQIAVANHRADLASLFFQFKADPKARLPISGSPLVWEAYGDAELLKAFLDAGADPNADGGDGYRTLLYMAASVGNADGVKALLAAGARVNPPTDARDTPLHVAVQKGDEQTVRLLLDAGAEVNRFNRDGFTPLWSAVLNRKTDVAAMLLAHEADPNLVVRGTTPLHFAVGQENRSLVQLLLTNKADVNLRDNHGKTPLDYAKEKMAGPRAPAAFGVIPPASSPSRQDPEVQPISPAALADLLRQHGALDDLPRTDRIEVRRASANYSAVVFTKGTNDWNQFSLLELIAGHYGLTTDQHSGVPQPRTGVIAGVWSREALRFPDFKRLVIHRPAADGRSWTTIPVNAADILGSGDCSRDVMLQWGDVVEIPEADHPVAENWPGLADTDVAALIQCVSRTVTLAISRTNVALKLSPAFLRGRAGGIPLEGGTLLMHGQARLSSVSFMLRSALDHSKLVRFSSDLTRVKVVRRDATTGQTREWLLDCSDANNAPDLWLRDGDVIEVPDKP